MIKYWIRDADFRLVEDSLVVGLNRDLGEPKIKEMKKLFSREKMNWESEQIERMLIRLPIFRSLGIIIILLLLFEYQVQKFLEFRKEKRILENDQRKNYSSSKLNEFWPKKNLASNK